MTDKDVLFRYRITQAEETLSDAEKMLRGNLSHGSILKRIYKRPFVSICGCKIS